MDHMSAENLFGSEDVLEGLDSTDDIFSQNLLGNELMGGGAQLDLGDATTSSQRSIPSPADNTVPGRSLSPIDIGGPADHTPANKRRRTESSGDVSHASRSSQSVAGHSPQNRISPQQSQAGGAGRSSPVPPGSSSGIMIEYFHSGLMLFR